MTKESSIGTAVTFFVFGIIVALIQFSFDEALSKTIHDYFGVSLLLYIAYSCFGIAFFFYVVSYFLKPAQKEWTCQKCNAILTREQIKFGLCPYCGAKVKNFRGMRSFSVLDP